MIAEYNWHLVYYILFISHSQRLWCSHLLIIDFFISVGLFFLCIGSVGNSSALFLCIWAHRVISTRWVISPFMIIFMFFLGIHRVPAWDDNSVSWYPHRGSTSWKGSQGNNPWEGGYLEMFWEWIGFIYQWFWSFRFALDGKYESLLY